MRANLRSIEMTLVLAALAGMSLAGAAEARDRIHIVGSSTVFSFAATVAEYFGKSTRFKTPVVESTGTGGGFKLFCAGIGVQYPDIANASRRIKPSEVAACEKNGVVNITEVKIGFDGIVIANARSAPKYVLTLEHVFRALAQRVPVNGTLVDNPYRTWNDIDSSLPAIKIEVLGPPPTSGTRDAFVELAMEQGAQSIEMLADLSGRDRDRFKTIAHTVREDGAYIEAGENDNLIVQKLEANPNALGIFGFGFLDQNTDRLKGSVIDGVEPTFENIAAGTYTIARSLYFYVKKAHVGVIPGIGEYIAECTAERAWGEEGYLADKGLIPLPKEDRAAWSKRARALANLTM